MSSQVTGIPLLFETPNSRPASLLIPAGGSTTHRLSPEMRATSPYWMPQSQVGYQTPPSTTSTNQSIASNPRHNQFQGNHAPPQQQQGPQGEDASSMVRRSPLPSPSFGYPIPQMNNNGMPNATPGIYTHNQQMMKPQYGSPILMESPIPAAPLNIGEPAGLLQINAQSPPNLFLNQASPRVRNPSKNEAAAITHKNETTLQSTSPSQPTIQPEASFNNGREPTKAIPVPTPTESLQDSLGQQTIAPATISDKHPDVDDFLPVFLLEKKAEEVKDKGDPAECTDDEDHNEWTADEQDGPATVIPLITELGIKDPQDSMPSS